MLIVRKTISIEEKLSIASDIKNLWATCISLMKKIGLSVLTPNMIYKNHHVTELNKHWHKLVVVVVGERALGGRRLAPCSGHFIPRKSLIPNVQEAGCALGLVWMVQKITPHQDLFAIL
jgi:hypothetical protein